MTYLINRKAKAAFTPAGFKEVDGVVIEQYTKFIEEDNDPKVFRAMADQSETLNLLQGAYTLEKELIAYKQQLISQGLDEEDADATIRQRLLERRNQPNVNQTTSSQSNVSTQTEVSSLTSDDLARINVGTLERQKVQASIFALPNAKTDKAKLGGEDISVVNDSNLGIDVLTRIGQLKQNFDAVVDSTGVDKEKASLAVNMLLGGVAGTVKSLVADKLVGDKVAAVQDRLTKEGVALVHGTDYDTVQQVSQREQLGNDTAKQLSNQLELTGEGINLGSGIIGGKISLGSKGTTNKTIDGKEVEVSNVGGFDLGENKSNQSLPESVTRNDQDFYSTTNHRGDLKAYINEQGDLVPPKIDGDVSITTHVRGSNPENTPYISITDPRYSQEPKSYGDKQITIDTQRLQQDIDTGKVTNTQIITHQQVRQELQSKVDAAQIKYDRNPTENNLKQLDRAKETLGYVIRDGECLIKDCVPSDYIKK